MVGLNNQSAFKESVVQKCSHLIIKNVPIPKYGEANLRHCF